MTNFGGAPVCSQPTSVPTTQITQAGVAPVIPAIPPSQPNVQSLWNAVQALTRAVQALAGVQPSNKGGGNFTEVSRKTQTKRIFNPQDDQQWVDIERVTQLTMKNSQGSTWTFNGKYND